MGGRNRTKSVLSRGPDSERGREGRGRRRPHRAVRAVRWAPCQMGAPARPPQRRPRRRRAGMVVAGGRRGSDNLGRDGGQHHPRRYGRHRLGRLAVLVRGARSLRQRKGAGLPYPGPPRLSFRRKRPRRSADTRDAHAGGTDRGSIPRLRRRVPAVALEGDELDEPAAEVFDGAVDHHENQEREDEDHRDDRKPVLDGRPASAARAPADVFQPFPCVSPRRLGCRARASTCVPPQSNLPPGRLSRNASLPDMPAQLSRRTAPDA